MIISNRINQTFGPAGTFAGGVLLIFGIFTIDSWLGAILILFGLFFTFSFSGTSINTATKKIRQYTKLMGLLKVGDWEDLEAYENLTILKNNSSFRISSLGNRQQSSSSIGYLIYVVGSDIRYKIPIASCRNIETAKEEIVNYSTALNLPIVDFSESK